MLDAIYVLATIAFFALMLAYVGACASIGRGAESRSPSDHASRGIAP
jgi:hypothetical protein